jgi:hypothetical protein
VPDFSKGWNDTLASTSVNDLKNPTCAGLRAATSERELRFLSVCPEPCERAAPKLEPVRKLLDRELSEALGMNSNRE